MPVGGTGNPQKQSTITWTVSRRNLGGQRLLTKPSCQSHETVSLLSGSPHSCWSRQRSNEHHAGGLSEVSRRSLSPCQMQRKSSQQEGVSWWLGESERFGLEGTLKITLFHPLCHGQGLPHQPRVLQALSNMALSTARAARASLGDPGQGPTTLIEKKFFLMSNLKLPSFSFKPLSLLLSL